LRILTILKTILRVYIMQFYGKNNVKTKYTYYCDWCPELLTYYIMSFTIIILILIACIIDLAVGGRLLPNENRVVSWNAHPRFINMIFTPFMSIVNALTYNIMIFWIILSCRMVHNLYSTVICNNNKSMYWSDQFFVRILFCTWFI